MKFYGTIEKAEKQADGTMHVSGYASSEAVDGDGEVIKAAAIKAAIPEFMKWANVREMHQAKAAGTVLEMQTNDDGKTWVKTHIVDSEACKKIEHKVYKGFSVGGRVTERDETDPKTIKGISLSEISLVDRPSNPDAVFLVYKIEGGYTDNNINTVTKREFTQAERDSAASSGAAMPDGSFPIHNTNDLHNAVMAFGRAKDPEATKRHIKARAKSLGAEGMLPDSWKIDGKDNDKNAAEIVELKKKLEELLGKAGARHNAGDKQHLESLSDHIMKASDHHEKMGDNLQECHKCMKGLGIDGHDEYINDDGEEGSRQDGHKEGEKFYKMKSDLEKVTAEKDEVQKELDVTVTVAETLRKRVEELEALPAVPVGSAFIVRKTDAIDDPDKINDGGKKVVKRSEAETRRDALMKTWSNPIPVNPESRKQA